MNRQLAEHFAVDRDLLLRERLDELRVADAVAADCGVDTRDPEPAEIALLQAAVAVGVGARADHGLVRLHECGATHAAVALRELADLLMPSVTDNSSFDSHRMMEGDGLPPEAFPG